VEWSVDTSRRATLPIDRGDDPSHKSIVAAAIEHVLTRPCVFVSYSRIPKSIRHNPADTGGRPQPMILTEARSC
jgi:hypothetical protein